MLVELTPRTMAHRTGQLARFTYAAYAGAASRSAWRFL
jgi:hypothetical protein